MTSPRTALNSLLEALGRTTHPGEKLNLIGLLTEAHGPAVAAWPATPEEVPTMTTLSTDFHEALAARQAQLAEHFAPAVEVLALAAALTPAPAPALAAAA